MSTLTIWLIIFAVLGVAFLIGYPLLNKYKRKKFEEHFVKVDEMFNEYLKMRYPPAKALEGIQRALKGSGIQASYNGRKLILKNAWYEKYCKRKGINPTAWQKSIQKKGKPTKKARKKRK